MHNKVSAQHRSFITENEGNVFLPSLQHRASKNFFGFLFCHTNTFHGISVQASFQSLANDLMANALENCFKDSFYDLLSTNVWKPYLLCITGCLGNHIKISQVKKWL